MHAKRIRKIALLAAAIALLAVSVTAAFCLLSPKEVAETMGDAQLAAAFDSDDAILMNETAEFGDYVCTVTGMVSGSRLSDWSDAAEQDHTYVVAAIARRDGTPLQQENLSITDDFTLTPLVSGYPAWVVNSWTLGAGATCCVKNGVAYCILDLQQLRMFADHTVYLAVYEGGSVPSRDMFDQSGDGPITMRDSVSGAMFTLPLDSSLADPAAVEQFIQDGGWQEAIDYYRSGTQETEAEEPAPAASVSADGGEITLLPAGSSAA